MATYQAGNKSERERPFLARVWTKRKPTYLGYYRTRTEAERAEAIARAKRHHPSNYDSQAD